MAPSWRDIGIGIVVGVIVGGFIFTKLGRDLAVTTISKGAKVTEAKVREWAKIGEA